nr:hypothetical protein [Nitrosomonas nitrosa]
MKQVSITVRDLAIMLLGEANATPAPRRDLGAGRDVVLASGLERPSAYCPPHLDRRLSFCPTNVRWQDQEGSHA